MAVTVIAKRSEMVATPLIASDYWHSFLGFPPVVPRADLWNCKDIEEIAVCSLQGEVIIGIVVYTFPSYIACLEEASCHGRRTPSVAPWRRPHCKNTMYSANIHRNELCRKQTFQAQTLKGQHLSQCIDVTMRPTEPKLLLISSPTEIVNNKYLLL